MSKARAYTQPFEERWHVEIPQEVHGLGPPPYQVQVYSAEAPAQLLYDSASPQTASIQVRIHVPQDAAAIHVLFELPQSGNLCITEARRIAEKQV
jgi:hypothetical protein